MVETNNFKRNSLNSLKDTQITLSYTAPDNTQYQDTAKITVYKVELTGPQNIVVGEEFGLTIALFPQVDTDATLSISQGTSYNEIGRAEKYWNNLEELLTTETYIHRFGIKLPQPATVNFSGSVSILLTQYTLEEFSIKVEIGAFGGITKYYNVSKEHVWIKVKATYIGDPRGSESESNTPGYFDNDKPRCALPYGSPSLFNSWIVLKKNINDDLVVEAKIRDRGPWFPYGTYYPKDNDWYNEYWNDGGYKPLAEFMYRLRRAGDTSPWSPINGSGIDLTQNAIESLGFTFNSNWSGNVYWRFK